MALPSWCSDCARSRHAAARARLQAWMDWLAGRMAVDSVFCIGAWRSLVARTVWVGRGRRFESGAPINSSYANSSGGATEVTGVAWPLFAGARKGHSLMIRPRCSRRECWRRRWSARGVRPPRQDALVIALHAVWSRDSQLCVWGESSALPVRAPRRRGRRPAKPRARTASVCLRGARPGRSARRLGGLARIWRAQSTASSTLLLPSFDDGPQHSPQLLSAE